MTSYKKSRYRGIIDIELEKHSMYVLYYLYVMVYRCTFYIVCTCIFIGTVLIMYMYVLNKGLIIRVSVHACMYYVHILAKTFNSEKCERVCVITSH